MSCRSRWCQLGTCHYLPSDGCSLKCLWVRTCRIESPKHSARWCSPGCGSIHRSHQSGSSLHSFQDRAWTTPCLWFCSRASVQRWAASSCLRHSIWSYLVSHLLVESRKGESLLIRSQRSCWRHQAQGDSSDRSGTNLSRETLHSCCLPHSLDRNRIATVRYNYKRCRRIDRLNGLCFCQLRSSCLYESRTSRNSSDKGRQQFHCLCQQLALVFVSASLCIRQRKSIGGPWCCRIVERTVDESDRALSLPLLLKRDIFS